MGYYHIYTDGKTVKELSKNQYYRLLMKSQHLLCRTDNGDVGFFDGDSVIYFSVAQLKQLSKNGGAIEEIPKK